MDLNPLSVLLRINCLSEFGLEVIAYIFTVLMGNTKILDLKHETHNFRQMSRSMTSEGSVPKFHLLQHLLGTHAVLGHVARGCVVGYNVCLTVMLKAMHAEVDLICIQKERRREERLILL